MTPATKQARIAMAQSVIVKLTALANTATEVSTASKYKAALLVHQQALAAMKR